MQEAQSREINLPEDNPETVKHVLSYMYVGYYNIDVNYMDHETALWHDVITPSLEVDQQIKEAALQHLKVYIAADKFGMTPLKEKVTSEFEVWVQGI